MMWFLIIYSAVLFSLASLNAQEDTTRKNLGHPFRRGIHRKRLRRQQQRKKQQEERNNQSPHVSVTTKVHPVGQAGSLLTKEQHPAISTEQIEQKNLHENNKIEFEQVKVLERAQEAKSTTKLSYPISSLYPKNVKDNTNENIEVNFNKTEFNNFLSWIESIFHVSFITGDALNPTPKDLTKLGGNTITYQTNRPLSKKQVWRLFLNFLELFNLSAIPYEYEDDHPTSFNIIPSPQSKRAALPSFIGTDYKELPDDDTRIRYVYFVQNAQVNSIYNVILDMIS